MAKKKVEEEVEFKEYSNENIIKEICNKVDDVELIDTQDEEFISTGNFALDYIISGKFWKGGIPLGRISEIYGNSSSGKTVVATHVLQNVQKEGGIAILIDSENAYNAQFAQVLGIDVKSLVYSNSETLEGCYTSIVKMVNLIRNKTNRPVMIVYDSIAASPSKDEREKIATGEDLKSEMGKRAQISSAYLRTLAGLLKKQRIGLVVINQLRSKVGVLYGCCNYETHVTLEDGTTEKIGKVVNQKIQKKIQCLNTTTGEIVFRPIKNYFKNGKADKFLQFKVQKAGENGFSQFGVTENHMIFTPDGEKPAGKIKIGDYVLGRGDFVFSPIQYQLAVGSLLGDGSLKRGKNGIKTSLRFSHGEKQIEYCKWKAQMFGNIKQCVRKNAANGLNCDLRPSMDLSDLYDLIYRKNVRKRGKFITKEFIDKLDLVSLAIWYLDDGSYTNPRNGKNGGYGKSVIYCPLLSEDELNLIGNKIEELGIMRPSLLQGKCISWSGKSCKSFQEKIHKYVHPSMDYKLNSKFKGNFELEPQFVEPILKSIPVKVIDIYQKPTTAIMEKFDLEVEDFHNYLVDGVCIHNSPDTTAGGGRSLEYYCSVRLECKKRKSIVDEKERAMGIFLDVNNTKNKLASPFRKVQELELFFNKGICPISGLLDILIQEDRVTKSGAWCTIVDTEYKFQAKNLLKALLDNPSLIDCPSKEDLEEFISRNKHSLSESISNEDAIEKSRELETEEVE